MSELLERESAAEQESGEFERIQDEATVKFQERGIDIDRDRLGNLVTDLQYGDLNSSSSNEIGLEYSPEIMFAKVERNGRVTVDRTEWAKLNEQQKLHAILHETSHRLDWLISASDNPHWQEIGDIIAEMDPNDLSSYVTHLADKYRDAPPDELAKIIRQEAVPELICQYIESDGSFKSFVEMSGLMTGNILNEFEELDDEAKEVFFVYNPELQFRFHIFVNLREVLTDNELIGVITSTWGDDYEEGFYDTLAMVADLPTTTKTAALPPKDSPPPKKKVGFDPFWLFRKN